MSAEKIKKELNRLDGFVQGLSKFSHSPVDLPVPNVYHDQILIYGVVHQAITEMLKEGFVKNKNNYEEFLKTAQVAKDKCCEKCGHFDAIEIGDKFLCTDCVALASCGCAGHGGGDGE